MIKRTRDYLQKAIKERSKEIDLSNCGLSAIPDEVFQMDWLERLELGNSGNPPQSSGGRNVIKSIPNAISNLKSLIQLNISDNTLADISALKHVPSLQELTLARNEISDIQPLKRLTDLTFLDLSHNKISDLAPLSDLTNLDLLYLNHNDITDISVIKRLVHITVLSLTRNNISNIEPLSALTKLRILFMSQNKITDISKLSPLIGLEALYLNENQITDIHPIKNFSDLEVVYLSFNQISDITPLKDLVKLTTVYMTLNKISDVSCFENHSNIKVLDVSHNQITDISPLLNLFRQGVSTMEDRGEEQRGIALVNNPIQYPPPEIVEQGPAAIVRYFDELKKGTYIVNEARVLIVGQGGSGKTSLRKKLKDKNADMPAPGDTTKGIEIDIVDVKSDGKDYKLHLWDFGGQNIQYYAHQFFLGDSSLYILLNNERAENANFQYWLNIIDMLGRKSPVMIVQNKIAGHCEAINYLAAIRAKFSNVLTTVHSVDILNAATDPKFDALKKDIVYHALTLPHIGKEYPASYVAIRERLRGESQKDHHFLTLAEYNKICEEEAINDVQLRRDIAVTFGILGICLYFKDDIELRNYLFLNPKWVIDALFRLLFHEMIIEQKGEFSENDVANIWIEPIYDGMHSKLLRMMEKFELCYRVKDRDVYIVPQRLPIAKDSYNWTETDATRIEYRYKFMPKGIITRIICRLHEKILNEHVWNDAVIFAGKKAKVFVREVYSEDRIAIEAAGENRVELLNRVIDEIDDIHKKSRYENLQVEKLIPCPCEQCINSKDPHFFDYDLLCQLLEDGETTERCKKSRKMIDINLILKTTGIKYQPKKVSTEQAAIQKSQATDRTSPYNVFISYSKSDKRHKDKLIKQLSPLNRANEIITWNDENLIPGEDWDERIKDEIAVADIILLLISDNSINTDYIWNKEINAAYERSQNQERVAVIPVILDFCVWQKLPFAKGNVLPTKGEPITGSKWKNQSEAWKNVVLGIETAIAALKK